MFERYTEKARRIIFFSRYEASQHGCRYVGVEHLLLGLMREDYPIVVRVREVEKAILLPAIEELCAVGTEDPSHLDLPLSRAAKRVLALGADEAVRLGDDHIGPEHLLLGVLLEGGKEAEVLTGFGVALERAREVFQSPAEASTPQSERAAYRQALEQLLAQVPVERLPAAGRILSGLGSVYFAVGGVCADGPFSYSFGTAPKNF